MKEPHFWRKNLADIPRFSTSFLEHFAAEHPASIKVTLNRSFKFIHEDYIIHEVEGDNFQFYSKQRRVPIPAY